MTTLDPLATTSRIRDTYRRYLRSTFVPRRSDLAREFVGALSDPSVKLTRGPFLQASAPFESGLSVSDLVRDGVLHPSILRLSAGGFPVDRPLYAHQESAVRKAASGRNLIVTTGTGSGKTETFLLPIIDRLLRETELGTIEQPGVRALLLYPMNALANDQVKRLRSLLRSVPEITFGRYIGDTKQSRTDAEQDFWQRYPSEPRVHNELLSRDEMTLTPPHILLTNYAMLEYLLLRPADSALFDGETGRHWRHIVLDEAHTYNGAQGAEVAMLLRRVKDRVVRSEQGRIQCFATSATLGRGSADFPQLIDFASNLFGERFEWEEADSGRQDIVTATRLPLVQGESAEPVPRRAYAELRDRFRSGATAADLAAVLAAEGYSTDESIRGVDPASFLHQVFRHDANVVALQEKLEGGSVELSEAAAIFEGADAARDLVALVDLCVAARGDAEDAPLIPARYHFFVRALEGAYLCLHPDHRDGEAKLRLARHDRCPSCARRQIDARMFELGVCRHCHAEYVVGDLPAGGGQLVMAPPFRPGRAFLLLGEAVDDDEDEAATTWADVLRDQRFLCPACGKVSEQNGCDCLSFRGSIAVTVARAGEDGMLHTCIACAGRAAGDVVLAVTTGTDAPVAVLATDLYQAIPPSSDLDQQHLVGSGRKLLTFSDSRQDAAYFAPYLERTYRRAVQRRLIAAVIDELSAIDVPRAGDVVEMLREPIARYSIVDDVGAIALRREAGYWVAQELLALDRRQSLEGAGVAEVAVALPRNFEPPRALLELGFDVTEVVDLFQLLLETVRAGGALTTPDQVNVRDERFAPRNVELGVREQGSGPGVITWLPGSAKNRRLEIVAKILARKGLAADPRQVLAGMWRLLSDGSGPWAATLIGAASKQGPLWKLDWKACEFRPLSDDHVPFRCDSCGRLTWRTVERICPAWGCAGSVSPMDRGELVTNHYASLYRDLEPIGIAVQEHTAQWDSERAGQIQQEFVDGRINVLSCSTTFELGVDVGEVQAVLLRNVPPGPANYVQRAGRAGRRTDSAALVVTFAQRRNHDLHYFADPLAMVDGMISPPRILVDSPLIVRRHVHSVAFAAFERQHVEAGSAQHRSVEDFFGTAAGISANEQFVSWLESRPDGLEEAITRIVPEATREAIGVQSWQWAQALVSSDSEDPTHGWLARAAEEVHEELDMLDDLMEEAGQAKKFGQASAFQRTRNTLARRELLGFLSSRNVLPKYGFPVDVVQLDLSMSGEDLGSALDLSRDLKLAIREFAPGNVVVAGKRLWRSDGLATRAGRTWPTYQWAVCKQCGVYLQSLGALDECRECSSTSFEKRGTMVLPLFGFVGSAAGEPGDTRPPRLARTTSYFGSYKSAVTEFSPVAGLDLTAPVMARANRQGRIAVINDTHGGYRLCEWCGAAVPAPRGKAKERAHANARIPGRMCEGRLVTRHLGHEFLTDVTEIRFHHAMSWDEAYSVLYALLEGAASVPALAISRDDIDGTLHAFGSGQGSFIIYDGVPGGAGYAQRIHDNLGAVIRAAHAVVANCDCGEETSCYQCLRSYGNQSQHEQLSRGSARDRLSTLLV